MDKSTGDILDCGHVRTSTIIHDQNGDHHYGCTFCQSYTAMIPQPNLAGRVSVCESCGKREDSSEKLLSFCFQKDKDFDSFYCLSCFYKDNDLMTTNEVASFLDISSELTIKNWLEGGGFPGSFKTSDDKWIFLRKDVEDVKMYIIKIRQNNKDNILIVPEIGNETT